MTRVRVRHGENEIEVEGSAEFIREHLDSFYQRIGFVGAGITAPAIKKEVETTKPKKPSRAPSPAEFYKDKGKTDGVSKLLIFAKYLELFKGMPEFTPADINQLAKQAKLSKDIHYQYFTNAVKQGLLRSHGGGKYSLTLSAEEVIASM